MLKNYSLILRLLIFMFTIRYAIAFPRCFAEFAWSIHPGRLITETFHWRMRTLESENVRQLYGAIEGLFASYQEVEDDMEDMGKIREEFVYSQLWMKPVDEAVNEELFVNKEAAKEKFSLSYRAYVEVVSKIAEESTGSTFYKRPDAGYFKWSQNGEKWKLLSNYRKRHHTALVALMGAIPYRYSNEFDVWQATMGKWHPSEDVPSDLCKKVWTKRYGDKNFANALLNSVYVAFAAWLGSVCLRVLEIVPRTNLAAGLQAWVLGILWSIYFQAPREAVLWLLRKVDIILDRFLTRNTVCGPKV